MAEMNTEGWSLTLCQLGNFTCFLSAPDFNQNQFNIQKILSQKPSECQIVLTQIRPVETSGLIWIQTICKCYHNTTLVGKELKGTATLMISMFYQKELYKPWILIQVSSKSVEKRGSYGHLKNSIWPTLSRHFVYSICFQNLFNCLIFSYQYYHSICGVRSRPGTILSWRLIMK